MEMSRREFLSIPPKALAAAILSGSVGLAAGPGCSGGDGNIEPSHPNILLLMVDQLQTPPQGYGPHEGVVQGLKEIFGFQALSPDNSFTKFFPAFLRLRQNGVVLRTHYTASSACVPSRACIMTGQYTTGVDQTTGMFKTPDDVTWLDPNGTPTIGDWFRAVGYTTHYFGKWHVSEPDFPDYLEPWGFSDWESSSPEPHGGPPTNLGAYRDVGFADNVVNFLSKKGEDRSKVPWFVVGSLVNPHDCSSWPVNWQMLDFDGGPDGGVVPWIDYPPPPPKPAEGDKSLAHPDYDPPGLPVELNPDGFPKDNCFLPPTFEETLDDKPRCQYEFSLKYGLAIKTKLKELESLSPLPFQLQGENASAWSLAYNQFYVYCHYLADLQIRRMLQALDDNGLTENTIVVFLSDHGDMTGAHGAMIQKWHSAYEEITRVPMVISSPLVNPNKLEMREISQPTSSIDLAPTLLGLAGYNKAKLNEVKASIPFHAAVNDFVGTDLSPYIKGEKTGAIPGPDGHPRPGVLYRSNDMITELGHDPDPDTQQEYDNFLDNVEEVRLQGLPLASGPVIQPNNVRALCTGDWKIIRYVDPNVEPNAVKPDEWELYYLVTDPIEKTNIVDFRTGDVRDDVIVPGWTTAELRAKNVQLKVELAEQESLLLNPAS